jgi:uncharacterized membrane protein
MKKKNDEIKVSPSTGLESNVAAALCYSLGLVTGLLFLVLEKDDKFVRYHAVQSILFNIVAIAMPTVLAISIIGIIFIPIWWIASVVIWIILMIKAYQGERMSLPIIGEIAKRQSE